MPLHKDTDYQLSRGGSGLPSAGSTISKAEGNAPLLCWGVAQPRLSVQAAGWLVHPGPLAGLFCSLL